MSEEVTLFRLYLIRGLFLLNVVLLGSDVWPGLITHHGAWDPGRAVAISFWAALSALSILGLRHPLKMVPLLLLQLLYKAIWLIAVALPQWSTVRSSDLTKAMGIGLVLDLIVIPWPYVVAAFVKNRGDRWKRAVGPVLGDDLVRSGK